MKKTLFLILFLIFANIGLTNAQPIIGNNIGDRATQVINVKSFGAKGDGKTDDSIFIAAAENTALTLSNGLRTEIYFPAGTYLIKSATLPLLTKPIAIRGDGPHSTYISVDPTYVGDVISYSEDWGQGHYGQNALTPALDTAGPTVRRLSIIGSTTAASTQNGIALYDRNDRVLIQDVSVHSLNGSCLSIGQIKNQSQAYIRESEISDLKCWYTGTVAVPAVNISSTTANGSDATNEVRFYGLRVFGAAGVGISVNNPNNFSATRLLWFFGGSVEQSGSDNVHIGEATDAGGVSGIGFFGFESISPPIGLFGFVVKTGGIQPYNITINGGVIGPGAGGGVDIENGSGIRVQVSNISVTGTAITTGANIVGSVLIDGNGVESGWSYNINPTTAQFVQFGSGARGIGPMGGPVAGRFYGPLLGGAPTNVALTSANRLFAVPFYLSYPATIKSLSFDIGTGNAAAWHAEMCIYADSGHGAPGNLITNSDTGSIAIGSGSVTGVQTSNINSTNGVTVPGPAWYWVAFEADSAAESLFSINSALGISSVLTPSLIGTGAAANIFGGTGTSGVWVSNTLGTCPSTFGNPTLNSGAATPYLVVGF